MKGRFFGEIQNASHSLLHFGFATKSHWTHRDFLPQFCDALLLLAFEFD